MDRRQAVGEEIPVPEGLDLSTDEEKLLWQQYSSMKSSGDWRVGDLVTLHQVVRLEVKVREAEKALNYDGWVIEDRFGALKPHPLADLHGKMTNQKLSILRALGLTIGTEAKESARKHAPSVADTAAAKKGGKRPNLLAVPT